MTPENFTYWLQGAVELGLLSNPPTAEQWEMIKDHLKLVFNKVTPEPVKQTIPFNAPLPDYEHGLREPIPYGPYKPYWIHPEYAPQDPYKITCYTTQTSVDDKVKYC